MSGLETAIRNALDRADRTDGDIRARIYQSARQALEAGLRRQGVTDMLTVLEQRKRLEEKILEIETQEAKRVEEARAARIREVEASMAGPVGEAFEAARDVPPEFAPQVPGDLFAVEPVHEPVPAARPDSRVDMVDVSRPAAPKDGARAQIGEANFSALDDRPSAAPAAAEPELSVEAPAAALGKRRGWGRKPLSIDDLARKSAPRDDVVRGDAVQAMPVREEETPARKGKREKASRGKAGRADVATQGDDRRRSAKPRRGRRRSFLSGLVTWIVTLFIVAVGCFFFYQSGMVQSVLEDADNASSSARGSQGDASDAPFDPRGGFSNAWTLVFQPSDAGKLSLGAQAQASTVEGAEGQVEKLVSASAAADGDIAITLPQAVLQKMAGQTSTVAITVQAGVNQGVNFSVRCDFGGLGDCSRHRFTTTQEKLEALFKVTLNNGTVSGPGRLVLNTGVETPGQPILLYAVRVLPGQ